MPGHIILPWLLNCSLTEMYNLNSLDQLLILDISEFMLGAATRWNMAISWTSVYFRLIELCGFSSAMINRLLQYMVNG